MKKIVTVLLMISLTGLSSKGQTSFIKPLKIGEKVPEITFEMFNDKNATVKLSDYKGKLVIIDFWATWCYSCIKALPKIDELQKKFKKEVKVIIFHVDRLDIKKENKLLSEFFEKWGKLNPGFSLRTAKRNFTVTEFFPYMEMPHYVWISKEGNLQAITGSDEVNYDNIKQALNDPGFSMNKKIDIIPNRLLELPLELVLINKDLPAYKIFRKGKIEGLSSRQVVRAAFINDDRNNAAITRGWGFVNSPLIVIYEEILLKYSGLLGIRSHIPIVFNLKDSSGIFFDSTKASIAEWEKKNLYTYDFVIPANEIDSISLYMLVDLNHYSAFTAKMEQSKQKCLVLRRTSSNDKISTKGDSSVNRILQTNRPYLKNGKMKTFVDFLQNETIRFFGGGVLFDETGFTNNIDIAFPSLDVNSKAEYSFQTLQKALATYDLEIIEAQRDMPVLVITEKDNIQNTKSTKLNQ